MDSAIAMEEAGAFSIVVEAVVPKLAEQITKTVNIPTIGIGSGKSCDGQVLVLADFLGLSFGKVPKFVKQYANVREIITKAVEEFSQDVRNSKFPDDEHEY
jgi:3-methyl-2-oxobutanoate hydroxymethyltransferase